MIGKHSIWIARELSMWVVTAAVPICFIADADKHRKAVARQDGGIEFTPNRRSFWAWAVIVTYLVYAAINQAMHIQGRLLNLVVPVTLGMLAVMYASSFPGKIIVTADGLEKISWLWKNKRIHWTDIVEINTGKKSHTVTITGADGTKIVHSRQLPDRPRLLMELKHYCGENLPSDFPRESIVG